MRAYKLERVKYVSAICEQPQGELHRIRLASDVLDITALKQCENNHFELVICVVSERVQ